MIFPECYGKEHLFCLCSLQGLRFLGSILISMSGKLCTTKQHKVSIEWFQQSYYWGILPEQVRSVIHFYNFHQSFLVSSQTKALLMA
jgi:hypothetical protein